MRRPAEEAIFDAKTGSRTPHLPELGEALVIVPGRGTIRPRDEVVVDVDHPRDRPLEEPLGQDLLVGLGQVFPQPAGDELPELLEVLSDQEDFARDQFPVDHRAIFST
ncbi:MAG: hypothetical protein HZA60_01125 [Deltaproteobacteria bacterium]|nr:hypothetical protein [Deltaproteobacteria bacterium]